MKEFWRDCKEADWAMVFWCLIGYPVILLISGGILRLILGYLIVGLTGIGIH